MHLQRQRYILFEYKLIGNLEEIGEKEITRSLWSSVVKIFGESVAYKTGLWMIKFNSEDHWGIIRCNNVTKEQVITSLAFITEIKKVPIIFHTIKTSGTIKKILKIQKEFFEKNRLISSLITDEKNKL